MSPPPPPPPPPSSPEVTPGASYSASLSCSVLVPPLSSSTAPALTPSPNTTVAAITVSAKDVEAGASILTSVRTSPSTTSTVNNDTRHHDLSVQGIDDASILLKEPPPSHRNIQAVPSSPAHSPTETSHLAVVESSSMVFADFYKGSRSPLAKLRHNNPALTSRSAAPPPSWLEDDFADLMAKDKVKQKEAVKRYLAAKVKADWEFSQPAHGSQDVSSMPHQGARARRRARLMQQEPNNVSLNTQTATKTEDNARQVDGGDDLCIFSEHDDDNNDLENDDDDDDDDDIDEDDEENDTDSIYSLVSEDHVNFRPRLDWASELSDNDDATNTIHPSYNDGKSEAVQIAGTGSIVDRRTSRRRANRDEMTWNEGLACFEARRDAWTGARTVRVRSKPAPASHTSSRSPRCFFFPRPLSGSALASNQSVPESPRGGEGGSFTTSDTSSITKGDKDLEKQKSKNSHRSSDPIFPVKTLLPLPHPLLPPNNTLRASITPSIYLGLYDKVILNNLQPACPINLSDMLRACVAGWKRDGEWPPRPSAPDPIPAARKKKQQQLQPKRASMGNSESLSTARRMSFGLLGRGGDDESRTGKGIRRSIQRVFGFGSPPEGAET